MSLKHRLERLEEKLRLNEPEVTCTPEERQMRIKRLLHFAQKQGFKTTEEFMEHIRKKKSSQAERKEVS